MRAGSTPAVKRDVKLATGCDVDGQALSGKEAKDGDDRRGLRRVDHLEVVGPRAEGLHVLPGA